MLTTTIRIILSAIFAALLSAHASSESAELRVGNLVLSYDAVRWRLERSSVDEAVLEPIGELRKSQDPVRFVKRKGALASTCRAIARDTWAGDLYADPEATPTEFVGRPATRLAVHTRCRNATPVGRITCAEDDGSIYAVMSVNAISDCRADIPVLYPDPAPLDLLLDGLRFTSR